MEVCRMLEPEFDCQAQVSVSQAFDGEKDLGALLKRILQQLIVKPIADSEKASKEEESTGGNIDKLSVDQLALKLEKLLRDKRYLIVVDDVWTTTAWDAIRSKLPHSERSSRIIVTTRIETVAKDCSDASANEYYMHRMKPLTFEDSKKLFYSRAFGISMDDASYKDELEVITESILKKCSGLPLAIVSIARLLASYKYPERKDMWETICKSIGSQMESNPTLEGMRQILTLSYNHLPYHLKGCMMYLSIFPEDYEINRVRLLYRWIAEGLVEEKRGLSLMEVAEGYFDELLSRNMIDPASSIGYNGSREACRVHDMMLEVLVSKSLEANFSSLLGGQYEGMSYDRIRRLSVHGGARDKEARSGGKREFIHRMEVQQVRSLSMFVLNGEKLLHRLGEFTLVRVLDLEDCQVLENKHVKDICRMHLLRFLSMRGTNISVLPDNVGELENLQVLDVDQTYLTKLPKTMTRLEKLERVRFRNKDSWTRMWTPPRGLNKMKAMREIDHIIFDDADVAKELGELAQLREINIFIGDLKSQDTDDEDILTQFVNSLSKLYSLRYFGIGRFYARSMNFLHRISSPPQLLRSFFLDGPIDKIPSWVTSLNYLVDIAFIKTFFKDDQLFGILCELTSLQNITLHQGSYVDKVLVARTAHNFPALRRLYVKPADIYSKPTDGHVIQFEKGSMDKLEELSVNFDKYMSSIDGIHHLENLKEVKLIGSKKNSSMANAVNQLKSENERRLDSKRFQFTIGVRYE